ncbi:uncharacterized protein IWZ02DRAFT_144052 [Phyllosticta citriasiana]|uniref:uncharacterized protein n=1 Tax=Phyllosticta citriasiana TaxID=595635 RepID=UPI0030FD5F81
MHAYFFGEHGLAYPPQRLLTPACAFACFPSFHLHVIAFLSSATTPCLSLAADGSQWGNTCAPEPPILLSLVAKPDFSPQTSRLVPFMVLPLRLWPGASDAKGMRVAIRRCADLPAPRARGVDGRPGKRFRCARRVVSAPASPCPACCWADWSRRLDGTARRRRQQAQTQMQTWACAHRTRHGTEGGYARLGCILRMAARRDVRLAMRSGLVVGLAWVCGDALDARMRVHRFCAPCYASLLPPRIFCGERWTCKGRIGEALWVEFLLLEMLLHFLSCDWSAC